MTIFDSPLYIGKATTYKGVTIRPMVMVLPRDPMLDYVDRIGDFNKAISSQVYNIINTLRGKVVPGMIVRTDIEKSLDAPEDVFLLQFHKTYAHRTTNCVFVINELTTDITRDLNDSDIVNRIIKKCSKFDKYDIKISIDDHIMFSGFGQTEVNDDEITDFKAKIM